MLFSEGITILELNSVTLRLVYLKKRENGFYPVYTKTEEYDGINDSMLVKPDRLFSVILKMISDLNKVIERISRKIYIILPQIFFSSNVIDCDLPTDGKVVTAKDVETLISKCNLAPKGNIVIDRFPIKYRTINEPSLDNPIGQICDRLYGKVSVLSMDIRIKEFFDNLAKNTDKSFSYMSEANVGAYLLNNSLKMKAIMRCLVIMREENITASLVNKEAVITSVNINWGANHIIKSLQDLLNISEDAAKILLSKLNLNVNCTDENVYVLNYGGHVYRFSMKDVNNRIIETLEYIFSLVADATRDFFKEDNFDIPIYLTGHDICKIKGVTEILSANMDTTMAVTVMPEYFEYTTQSDYILSGAVQKISERIKQNSLSGKTAKIFRRIKNGI